MGKFEIITADVVDWSSSYEGQKFHAILCDPPYGLEFMGKSWDSPQKLWEQGTGFSSPGIGERDTPWPSAYNASAPNLTCATCGGRLRGKKKCRCPEPVWKPLGKRRGDTVAAWPPAGNLGGFADGNKPSFARQGDFAGKYQEWCEQWAADILPVLYPGALALYFGGTRTSHRLACGIEDAGMVMWDTIMWLYGTGFPKAQALDKLIDQMNGDQRQVVGYDASRARPNRKYEGGAIGNLGGTGTASDRTDNGATLTAPASDQSSPWAGHKTCALKPAVEPILCFKAPMGNHNYAELATLYGCGCLNIDGTRIPTEEALQAGSGGLWSHIRDGKPYPGKGNYGRDGEASAQRRYTEEGSTNFAPTPGPRGGDARGRYPANVVMDDDAAEMLDEQSGERVSGGSETAYDREVGLYEDGLKKRMIIPYHDTGGASRFFYRTKASRKEREIGLMGHVPCVKCGRLDSEKHITASDDAFEHLLIPNTEPPVNIETTEGKCVRNDHPTVKPISLCYWLATLLLPPPGDKPRRILVPFSGSGSEMIACLLAGWDEVVGIEKEPRYRDIAVSVARRHCGANRLPIERGEMALRHGSLFSGIGMIDFALEAVGFETAWQVEIDIYCRAILKQHWPRVPRYSDVRKCGKHNLGPIDLLSGGFPCTDISGAGLKEGIGPREAPTSRSGLWYEFHRIIEELRPRWVLIENVHRLLHTDDGEEVIE